jgi:hypothetical protein
MKWGETVTDTMTTGSAADLAPSPAPRSTPGRMLARAVGTLGVLALVLVVLSNLRRGAVAERIVNPGVTGTPGRVDPLFGIDAWYLIFEIASLVIAVGLWAYYGVTSWRDRVAHPVLMMLIALTALTAFDPLMNFLPFATYDPRLLHFPESWAYFSISPTVEPIVVLIGYPYFFLIPVVPAMYLQRRRSANAAPTAFINRRPLLWLFCVATAIGFVWDAVLEMFLTRIQLYLYSHVIPFGSVFTGQTWQFPLLVESGAICGMMGLTAVLLHRDDTGATVSQRLVRRWKVLPKHPVAGVVLMMWSLMGLSYLAYGTPFAIIRATHSATEVARPWPYREAKVFDPQGFYANACEPGPYFTGPKSWCPNLNDDPADTSASCPVAP